MAGYVFDFGANGQYDPDGRVSVTDVKAHNASIDAAVVEAMKRGERVVLYLSERKETGHASVTGKPYEWTAYEVATWAGNWKATRVQVSLSDHNMAGRNGRRDVWFNGPDGSRWHGVNIGGNQILRCHKLKTA